MWKYGTYGKYKSIYTGSTENAENTSNLKLRTILKIQKIQEIPEMRLGWRDEKYNLSLSWRDGETRISHQAPGAVWAPFPSEPLYGPPPRPMPPRLSPSPPQPLLLFELPSTIIEAAFGRLHNSGSGAFGARPTVVESIMVDGEIDGSIYGTIYPGIYDSENGAPKR